MRIFAEIISLQAFAGYCDSAGLRIPCDSGEFRRKFLDPTQVMDSFIFHRQLWPSSEYFEIMALAQHYGLPTRLLDWTRNAYVAVYFAASGTLMLDEADSNARLAVWVLNTENIPFKLKDIDVVRVPGGNNANIGAQSGLFTLVRQKYTRGGPFQGVHCLDDYVVSCGSSDLAKITLPITEAPKLIDLCERHGVTAATIYPDFYGAARPTRDSLACWSKAESSGGQGIRAATTPAWIDVSK